MSNDMSNDMSEERTLLVGVDLCEDVSQITCFNAVTFESESIGVNGDIDKCMIPTVLFYKRETGDWTYGEEAYQWNREQDGILVKGLLDKASRNDRVMIDGREYEPEFLIEKFLKRLLGLLKMEHPNNTIRSLVVTVREKNMLLIQRIYEALQNLGISKVRANVQSHEQCFVNYAMNQPKELRVSDMVLFDFDDVGLKYYQISVNRRTEPHTVLLKKRDFSEILPYQMLLDESNMENAAYLFESLAQNALHKQIVSTVYVTGKGFQGNWCKEVLKKLCLGRRVFAGQNLYAKGAGYAARESVGEGKLKEYLYLGEEMVPVNISMPLFANGVEQDCLLVEAGTAWYNAATTVSFIPDGEIEIELIFEHVTEQQAEHHFISLDGLWNINRKTRVEMTIDFLDVNTCVVRVNDRGFGDMIPSSNRVWEKEIQIRSNQTKNEV